MHYFAGVCMVLMICIVLLGRAVRVQRRALRELRELSAAISTPLANGGVVCDQFGRVRKVVGGVGCE
jgi:hypothetical protein